MERVDARATILAVDNETKSTAVRTTVDGRQISYQLRVLQQPQRARACGQGAKSSADRRPVDPPPIVELKIMQDGTDITFAIRASYFLFATLEQARPMAHGRVTGERTEPPVLTGTPVAGMVYLDRPNPAGYFIFPDLSVRHEGKYRLSFSLYEELKEPNDADKPKEEGRPGTPDSHVTHRLDVRSEPFQVFSAKKFPGLTESTQLSRVVAEQGCRVRIRRDVRMRRRDTKANGKDWDDYEDDTPQNRARMSGTPDPNGYAHGYGDPIARPRSASNVSHHSLSGSLSRRPSLQEMNQGFAQPHFGTAPHTPQNGGYAQASPYGPSPSTQYPPQFLHQSTAIQPPPLQYAHSYAPPPPPAPAGSQNGYFSYPPAPAPSQAPPPPHGPPHAPYEQTSPLHHPAEYPAQHAYQVSDHRRANSQAPLPPAPPAGYGYQAYQATPQQSHYTPPPMLSRPSAAIEPRTTNPTLHPSHEKRLLPPIQTTMMSSTRIEASSPVSATAYRGAGQTPIDAPHKRSYGDSFKDPFQDQALRHGARPGSAAGNPADGGRLGPLSISADDDQREDAQPDNELAGMHYRRADGRTIRRSLAQA